MRPTGRLCLLVVLAACGTPPEPRPAARPAPVVAPPAPAPDPCEPVNGKPAPPLTTTYSGVLRSARCQPEVLTIMQGVAKALGTGCDHCHDEMDFGAPTQNKRIANWMATELEPRLAKRSGGAVACADCHADDGKGKAKILGSPRRRERAVEWMTANLVERFDAAAGGPLYCKTCHVGQFGTARFEPRVILTDHLPPLPRSLDDASTRSDAGDAGAAPPHE